MKKAGHRTSKFITCTSGAFVAAVEMSTLVSRQPDQLVRHFGGAGLFLQHLLGTSGDSRRWRFY